ncbi:general transcription factor 3C polypeptide 6-like [Lingula anatina]|uniref:General transcription factor 3C polypeptide 6-like n=1 Tax=Lingula anatina TaxID=7574 RepID=A0A1S3HTK2_LINAN|nr:general transcription factor 3C polypeptide 6-like [Lingula anatina]|eukprot:XP_013388389.1 general transcription factor 3C polypeptide 6-like [Lingula anatina]
MSGSEEWELEEEAIVVVELSGIIDNDTVTKKGTKYKILGAETEQPVMQVDRYIFVGEYEDTVGAAIIMEPDPTESDQSKLKYKCHTLKKLSMQRAFLEAKDVEKLAGQSTDGAEQLSEGASHEGAEVMMEGAETEDMNQ